MKGQQLTDRQKEVLDTIRSHVKRRGIPPTRAELATDLDLANQAGVDRYLSTLQKKGWLRLHTGVDRGIHLLREGAPIFGLEELPEVAAGNPKPPGDYSEPRRLHDLDTFSEGFESTPSYFLKVTGDSMNLAGFNSGDIVAVKEGKDARNGDIVVARIGEAITLKRFHRENEYGNIELQPVSSNDEHLPIQVGEHTDFEISGIVVGAIIPARRPHTHEDR